MMVISNITGRGNYIYPISQKTRSYEKRHETKVRGNVNEVLNKNLLLSQLGLRNQMRDPI